MLLGAGGAARDKRSARREAMPLDGIRAPGEFAVHGAVAARVVHHHEAEVDVRVRKNRHAIGLDGLAFFRRGAEDDAWFLPMQNLSVAAHSQTMAP